MKNIVSMIIGIGIGTVIGTKYGKKAVRKIEENNDINGEKFDMVIKDDIDSGFVDIVDIRGIVAPQIKAMEDLKIQVL